MAYTKTFGDAVNVVSQTTQRKVEDTNTVFAVNTALNYLWTKADWRESIASLPPFFLRASEQDYGKPVSVVPSDFFGLREAYLMNVSAGAIVQEWELKVERDLGDTSRPMLPETICYLPSKQCFRVHPRPPEGVGCDYIVTGTYKKRPVAVTMQNLHVTTLPWDDVYFHVFCAVLTWAFYQLTNHPNTIQALQYANVLIEEMKESEGLNLGNPSIAPDHPLVYPWYFR